MRIGCWLLILCCCIGLQSCATMFSGLEAETTLIANSSELDLLDSLGRRLNVSKTIKGDRIEYNFELDKREPYHDILIRKDSGSHRVRYDRRVNSWWWLANLLTYELGSLVDLATEEIYYFPEHTIEFSKVSTEPIVSKLDSLTQLEHKLLVSGFVGYLIPVSQNPITFTTWGTAIAVQVRPAFWLGLGLSSGSYLKTSFANASNVYNTSAQTIELYSQYYPAWGLFASVGLGAQRLSARGSYSRNRTPSGFSSGLWTFGFGAGINYHGFLVEWRRYLGLNRIDTREEANKSIRFDQFRIGFGIGLNPPSKK
jgi:hypothetical protein